MWKETVLKFVKKKKKEIAMPTFSKQNKPANKAHSTFPFIVEASSIGTTNSLRIYGIWPTISTAMMLVPQRGGSQRTECPEDSMLLWSTALLMALSVFTSFLISGLCEDPKGTPSPSLGSIIGTHNNSA